MGEFAGEGAARFMSRPEARWPMHRFLARWFPEGGHLLDLGCGTGDLVAFANARGLRASGIDRDAASVANGRARGLDVVVGDVFDLPPNVDRQFDVITMEHLIEHFDPVDAVRLLEQYAGRLRPGGRLIVVTPNPSDWTVLSEIFWLDPTHVRPYPARLLTSMLMDLDLRVIHASTERLVGLGIRAALRRPIGRLRFGREFQRMNLVVVAERRS